MDVKEILEHVDHTLLKQTATWEDIKQICDDGIKYGCASVCIPQTYVNHAAHYVAEQQHYGFGQLPICTVIGFPNGYTPSGMGMPSIGIYSYELFTQYDVESIIRVGSAGALQKDLKLGDVVAGMGACTNSNYAAQYGLGGTFAPIADFQLLSAAVESAKELGVRMDVGNLYSSDTFYDASNPSLKWADMGVLAIEMEAAALYCNAAYTKKRGLSLCSISDNILTGEELSPEARQTSFTAMMKIALETAVKMAAESQK